MKHCKKIMSLFLTAILLTVLAACSNGSNGDSSDNEKNGNSVVCTYVQEYDESNYYIFYADGTVEGYLNGKLEYPRSTLKYEGTPTSEGTVNVKVNTGAILLILTVMKNGDSIIAKDNFGMSYTVKGNSGENSDGKEKEGGDDNNSGTLCTWHMDGDESTYFIFYADGLIEYYEKGKVQYEKGMLKYSGTPTEDGIVTIEENTGVILFNFKVSDTWAYQLNSETGDVEAKYIIKTDESENPDNQGNDGGSEDNTTGSDSSGDDETPSKKMFMGFDNVVTIENGTDMVGITNTIYSLTSDTTLKFKGGINAITLTTIAAAIGTNDSVKIALDFSETTGITEWTNKLAGQKTLYAISLPNTVTSVADGAFDECTKLKAITVPKSITEFPSEIPSDTIINFQGTIWEWLKISTIFPDGQTLYLNGKELMSAESGFILPKGITSIPGNAFEGCTWLTSITIPDGVTEIGDYAFKNCSALTTITIPESIKTFGEQPFRNCANLDKVYYKGTLETWFGISTTYYNSVFFIRVGSYVYKDVDFYIGGEIVTDIVIPESITYIRWYAFSEFKRNLKTVTIPETVRHIVADAFEDCQNISVFYKGTLESWLANVTVDGSVSLMSFPRYFNFYINEINVNEITDVEIPSSLTKIRSYAFAEWKSLKNVTIPNGVTEIQTGAFCNCEALEYVTIPDTVTSIGTESFCNCPKLTIKYRGSEEQWKAINIGGNNGALTIIYNYTGD